MTLVHFFWAFAAANGVMLGIAGARRAFQRERDAFADRELGPGDVHSGHYLASGRIVWQPPAAPAGRKDAQLRRRRLQLIMDPTQHRAKNAPR